VDNVVENYEQNKNKIPGPERIVETAGTDLNCRHFCCHTGVLRGTVGYAALQRRGG